MASHAAVAVAGVLFGVLLVRHRRDGGSRARLTGTALGGAASLVAAGILLHALHDLHPAFRINKILATPPWCLLSCAITAAVWVGVFALTDVKAEGRVAPRAVSIAGENALVCYLLPTLFLSLFAMSAPLFGGTNLYEKLGEATWIGALRSAAFAWIVVRLAGRMREAGVRPQI